MCVGVFVSPVAVDITKMISDRGANNESSEVFDIQPGRRDKLKGYRQ